MLFYALCTQYLFFLYQEKWYHHYSRQNLVQMCWNGHQYYLHFSCLYSKIFCILFTALTAWYNLHKYVTFFYYIQTFHCQDLSFIKVLCIYSVFSPTWKCFYQKFFFIQGPKNFGWEFLSCSKPHTTTIHLTPSNMLASHSHTTHYSIQFSTVLKHKILPLAFYLFITYFTTWPSLIVTVV